MWLSAEGSHTDGGGLHEPCVTVDTGSLIEPSLFQRILFGTAKNITDQISDGERTPCLRGLHGECACRPGRLGDPQRGRSCRRPQGRENGYCPQTEGHGAGCHRHFCCNRPLRRRNHRTLGYKNARPLEYARVGRTKKDYARMRIITWHSLFRMYFCHLQDIVLFFNQIIRSSVDTK